MKFTEDVNIQPGTIIPDSAIESMDEVGPEAFAVYAYLMMKKGWKRDDCPATEEEIGTMLSMSRKAVKRALMVLNHWRWIEIQEFINLPTNYDVTRSYFNNEDILDTIAPEKVQP